MPKTRAKLLLNRLLKKSGVTDTATPSNMEEWTQFLERVHRAFQEYDEARMSSENVLEVSLKEMERLQKELSETNQKEQKELNEYLKLILSASDLGVWDWDLTSNAVKFDQRWCEILGYELNEVPGNLETFSSKVNPAHLPRVLKLVEDYLSGKVPRYEIQFQMKHKNGHWADILAKGRVISFSPEGKPLRFLGTHLDLTEEKIMQREIEDQRIKLIQSSKLASLGEMSAGIAHEINNPLTIISGSIFQLTRLSADPERFAAKIETINKACTRISKIIGGLRKFARAGDKSVQEPHSLCGIIKEAVILTESKAKQFDVQIQTDCATDAIIFCNEIEIEQVLVNLMSNAMDAIKEQEEKWVKISVIENDSQVILRVIDSGKGISFEVESKLFNPFFTTKKIGEGTGLGLSISKGILEEHHASIRVVRDSPNTCFEVQFPKYIQQKVA